MRLYYFTGTEYALENIQRQHLKISFSSTVNDLFELKPFDFGKRSIRQAWQKAINTHAKTQGFISFSPNWQIPTMWAHYSENHKGVCYGFDIQSTSLTKIEYEPQLKLFDKRALTDKKTNDEVVRYASRTKSSHWSYEDEWRQYITLDGSDQTERENGQEVFLKFSDALALKEILIGARSKIKSDEFRQLTNLPKNVTIRTVRPSFRCFKMVEQKSKRLQN